MMLIYDIIVELLNDDVNVALLFNVVKPLTLDDDANVELLFNVVISPFNL